jgi:hypothetical protein
MVLALAAFCLGVGSVRGAETKTDLAREVYVEFSQTNTALTVTHEYRLPEKTAAFAISAPTGDEHTLLCFVDGRIWEKKTFAMPGTYSVSLRGVAPGEHRITIQLIDSSGQVGRYTVVLGK